MTEHNEVTLNFRWGMVGLVLAWFAVASCVLAWFVVLPVVGLLYITGYLT